MSIFRETFPLFIQEELNRRQDGMADRNPAFLQQLNTRNAWVRMTSGVNTLNASKNDYTNNLASNYILQGGTLSDNKLRTGLGGSGTSTYDTLSPGGVKHRLGIRPMPGITNVSIQSKGAYGSLQEATVSFNCWDIKQLEDLELLYMRPGYTVLLEFGWNFAKDVNGVLPQYKILNKSGISINDAFAEIYTIIEQSNGTYDALLGYVKNYNWSARDDGGYDCTTTIISLGEVLESLKVNWIPMSTKAFDEGGAGLLNQNLPKDNPEIITSYEQGIIPGLLHELWDWMSKSNNAGNFSNEFIDTQFNNTRYKMFMSRTMGPASKEDRGGFPKPLGTVDGKIEGWITLGSFCDLLNNYVLLKDQNNNPISLVTTYETNAKGEFISEGNSFRSLKCIASPLSLSTNLGVCLVRNDNWDQLVITEEKEAKKEDEKTTTPPPQRIATDISDAVKFKTFIGVNRFSNLIKRTNGVWTYSGGSLKNDIEAFVNELQIFFKDFDASKPNDIQVLLTNGEKFPLTKSLIPGVGTGTEIKKKLTNLNWLEYFNPAEVSGFSPEEKAVDLNRRIGKTYEDLFLRDYVDGFFNDDPFGEAEGGVFDASGKTWTKAQVLALIKDAFTNAPLNSDNLQKLQSKIPEVASSIAEIASTTQGISGLTIEFLTNGSKAKTGDKVPKSLGNIANIYVNINYLYSQAISKNVSSNDNQNTNVISIREYLQGILKEIQNSLGNINDFDIQVDNRTAIGRIIDINFTGDPDKANLFPIKLHNTNSVARKYNFQSKIFPEMGAIIAISAQDTSGIGKLGYDNATLIAWNEGLRDRLIPKKDFSSTIKLSNESDVTTFLLPFLGKIYSYFQALGGSDTSNINFAYGGLNFAYRDFLANLSRYDERNNFKTIIPTELSITLDGIGGMVIGNLFSINQEVIPKGYRGTNERQLAYIVTKLSHNIQDNDWTTDLSAYPIIFENTSAKDITKKWTGQKYPGQLGFSLSIGGKPFAFVESNKNIKASEVVKKVYIPARNIAIPNRSEGLKILLTGHVSIEGFRPGTIAYDLNNPGNFRGQVGNIKPIALRQRIQSVKVDPKQIGFAKYATLADGILTQAAQVDRILAGKSTAGYTPEDTLFQYLSRYSTVAEGPGYTRNMIAFFRNYGVEINANTKLKDIIAITKLPNGKTVLEIEAGNTGTGTPSTPTEAQKKVTDVKVIAQGIKNAAADSGTNISNLISSIKQIKDVNTFREVNKIVNIQKILNDELGIGNVGDAREIKTYLATIGVIMDFTFTSVLGVDTNVDSNSIKITYK